MIYCLLLVLSGALEVKEEGNVIIMETSYLRDSLEAFPRLFIYFYNPDYKYFDRFAPEFEKITEILPQYDPSIRIAKMNIPHNPALAQTYGGSTVFSVITFKDSTPYSHKGKKTAAELVPWILKVANKGAYPIPSLEELQSISAVEGVTVVYFGEQDTNYEEFQAAAASILGILHLHTNSTEIAEFYGVKSPTIRMLKDFDERVTDFAGEYSQKEIREFILSKSTHWAFPIDREAIEYIFKEGHSCLILFRHESEHKQFNSLLRAFGKKYQGTLCVAYLDGTDPQREDLVSVFGVKPTDQPVAVIVDSSDGSKYKLGRSPDKDSLKAFVSGWVHREISPYFKSEPVPEKLHQDGVRVLVGTTFEEVVYDPEKDVVVLIYSTKTKNNPTHLRHISEVASKTRAFGDIVIAQIDGIKNDLKGVSLQDFPTVYLFPKTEKTGIRLQKEFQVATVLELLQKHSLFPEEEGTDL